MNWLLKKTKGDFVIWMVVLLLSIFGMLAVYSSTGTLAYKKHGGNTEFFLFKHLGFLGLGLFLMYLSHLIDYRYYSRISQLFLFITYPLLAYTLLFGSNINDANRWITIPGVGLTFQTSDLAKLALVMFIARFLSKRQEDIKDLWKTFLPIMAAIIGVCLLIAPANLSTALVLFSTCLLLLFIGRVNFKYLLVLIASGVLMIGLFLALIYNTPDEKLKSFGRMLTWKNRIESYVHPDEGSSYQADQAKIAVATGGVMGKGPGRSTQRNFLPNPFSDFIFAIILEEYGLWGALILISLYLILLMRCIRIVIRSPRAFGALLAVGLGFSLVIQAFINMAIAVNLFPVTGLALPLVSMGGTSTIFTSLALGIILSVSKDAEPDAENDTEPSTTNQGGNTIAAA